LCGKRPKDAAPIADEKLLPIEALLLDLLAGVRSAVKSTVAIVVAVVVAAGSTERKARWVFRHGRPRLLGKLGSSDDLLPP